MRPVLTVSALIAALGLPALADEVTGEILAYDRVASIIVLSDKTVWPLMADLPMPEGLAAGETVTITFESAGESGVAGISAVVRAAN